MPNRPVQSRGFTLIELMLVMALIVIMSAIIAPTLRGFALGRRTKDSAAMIVGVAQYGRTAAMSEGRVYRLNFDPTAGQVWLTAENGTQFQPPTGEYGERFQVQDGVKFSVDVAPQQDGQYIQFQPTGRTDTAHIVLTGPRGDTIEVACATPTETFHVLTPAEEAQ
jgi:prepilin-type N-terminal cleavage/methylation domain-containing protein